jgi:hypothetical protein
MSLSLTYMEAALKLPVAS